MKKLLTFLTLLTLSIGVGWAETATITFGSSNRDVSSNSATTVNGFTITCTGDNNNWGDNNDVRFMANSTMTIDGGTKTITSIVFNTTSRHFSSASADVGTCTVGTNSMTWTGSSTSVTVTNTGSAQARITDIVITYTAGQTEPDPTTPSGTITFTPAAGEVTSGTTVAISFSGSCTGIKYTTNGDTPDDTHGTVYNASNPPVITGSTTIKAAAYNYSNSKYAFGSVTTAEYTVTIPSVDYNGTATFNATIDKDLENVEAGEGTITKTPVTFTCSNGILGNGSEYRLYKNSTTTFSVPANSGCKIVKIEFTGVSGYPVSGFGVTPGLIINGDDGTWTGETESVSFTASGAQVRCKLINVYYTEPSANDPVYYLYGTFNNWNTQDENYKFNLSNGTYSITGVDLPDNVRFKISKVVNGQVTEYGASNGGKDYDINGGWNSNIPMNGADAYTIASGALTNITLNTTNMTFNVSRDAQFFVKGDFNGWNREAMTATASGDWTKEQVISLANQFGFVDEWGYWYGGNGYWIKEVDLDNGLEIKPDGNFYMDVDGTDDYTLTVNSAKTTLTVSKIVVIPSDDYVLVTDVNDLDVSSSFIIVSKDYSKAMAGQNSNNRAATSITLTDNGTKTAANSETQVFTLEPGTNGWYFYTGSGYLYAASSGSNYLRTETEKDDNALAAITIDSNTGQASVVFQGENTRNVMQYNNTNILFACYADASMKPVYLYKKVEVVERSTPPVITPASQNVKGGLLEGVMITAAEGATIYYTLDGSEPIVDSREEFDGQAFNVSGTGGERKMVRAIAVEANKAPSYPASVTYTFQAPATPTISPAGGTYGEAVTVTITSADGGIIYYLVDPEEAPTNAAGVITAGQVYDPDETEIILSENGTYKVYAAVNLNGITSWAQVSYTINIPVTINPPVFLDYDGFPLDGEESISDGYPIYIGSEYGPGATLYYLLDPETVPADANEVKENGISCGEYNEFVHGTISEVFLGDTGQHTIYAVVEIEGYLSSVASITLNVYAEGEWKLVESVGEINPMCEYIIVNSDYNMAIGSYGNGEFNAVACGDNITFDPNHRSATVNNTDNLMVFGFEAEGPNIYNADIYMKDAAGTYYSLGDNVGNNRTPIYVNIDYDYDNYSYSYIVLKEDYYASNSLAYNSGHFGMFADGSPIAMYYRSKPVTLAEIVANDMSGLEVTVGDELVAVKCVQAGDGVALFCKDLGMAVDKTENPDPENIEDYMIANHFFNGDWDQSNWVVLAFENASLDDVETITAYEGMHIKAGTVTGYYYSNNRTQHIINMRTKTLEEAEGTQAIDYTPNLYCPANFLPNNHNGNATGTFTNAQGEEITRHYFFVNPKIEEVCEITFAVWRGNNCFTLPAADGVHNMTNIKGAFNVDWRYNEFGDVSGYLDGSSGEAYRFNAIVERQTIVLKSPMLKDGETTAPVDPQDNSVQPDRNTIVYPLDFSPENDDNIVTGIDTVNMLAGNGEVKSVKYVNVAGMVSDTPFQGMNIVVIEYTNGTRTTTKMISK